MPSFAFPVELALGINGVARRRYHACGEGGVGARHNPHFRNRWVGRVNIEVGYSHVGAAVDSDCCHLAVCEQGRSAAVDRYVFHPVEPQAEVFCGVRIFSAGGGVRHMAHESRGGRTGDVVDRTGLKHHGHLAVLNGAGVGESLPDGSRHVGTRSRGRNFDNPVGSECSRGDGQSG